MDELFGSLTAYEMRTLGEETSKKESTFNSIEKGKEEIALGETSEDSDIVVVNFVRKITRGSDKYKEKLPFKCFNCGKIRHFASKCPYGENGGEELQSTSRPSSKDKKKKAYQQERRSYRKQNNLYTFEDDATDEESASKDECCEDEREINLFMALKNWLLELMKMKTLKLKWTWKVSS